MEPLGPDEYGLAHKAVRSGSRGDSRPAAAMHSSHTAYTYYPDDRQQAGEQRRKPCCSVAKTLLIMGLICGLIGMLLASVGLAGETLLNLRVIGGNNANYRRADLSLGLFSHLHHVTHLNGTQVILDRRFGFFWLEESHQYFAWLAMIAYFLFSTIGCIFQTVLVCQRRLDGLRWFLASVQLTFQLLAVVAVLICVALSETQVIRMRTAHDDRAIQYVTKLLTSADVWMHSGGDRVVAGINGERSIESGRAANPTVDSFYTIDGPRTSFCLFLAANGFSMAAFVLSVPFCLVVSEKEKRHNRAKALVARP